MTAASPKTTPTKTNTSTAGTATRGTATSEPIETWAQWRDWRAGVVRREYGCTHAEARHSAETHRDLWDSYVLRAFEAGRDFTPRAIADLPAYLLHRMTGTPRWQNREMGLHPDANPLRRYRDRLTVLNTPTS